MTNTTINNGETYAVVRGKINQANAVRRYIEYGAISRGLNTPPGSPSDGDVYIIGALPTGAWSGQANKIAVRHNGAWIFEPSVNPAGSNVAIGAAHEGLSVYVRDEDTTYTWSGTAWVSEVRAAVSGMRREKNVPVSIARTAEIPHFTARWAAAQFLTSSVAEVLVPQIPVGGSGDEGYHTITGDGVRSGFPSLRGLAIGNTVAFNDSGAPVTVTETSTSPPTVTLGITPAAGALTHVWRHGGRLRVPARAKGIKISLNLLHGTLTAANQQINIVPFINDVPNNGARLEVEHQPSSGATTSGTIVLPTAKAGDTIHLVLTHLNDTGSIIGIQPGSRIAVEALAAEPMPIPRLVGGIHQGAPLTDAEIPNIADKDIVCVSGMWSGNIANSGRVRYGQTFFDGFVSSAWDDLARRLNEARRLRALSAMPGGPIYLAYMAAAVAAPDGTLSGQFRFDYFDPTAGQADFTASRDVVFSPIASTSNFTCGSHIQVLRADGQRTFAYGGDGIYTQISPGVYRTTHTALGVTAQLTWSGTPLRNLNVVFTQSGSPAPLVVGDLIAISHQTDLTKDPWTMTDAGRANVREMIAMTYSNPELNTLFDGVFLDLCASQWVPKEDLWEIISIVRQFAPQGYLMCNATVPTAEQVEHIATCPFILPGDYIMLESAGSKLGVTGGTVEANTLRAVETRNRISANGKHVRLAWLATEDQSYSGAIEDSPNIQAARTLFLANSAPGDVFMAHWTGLGLPHNGNPRPQPPRISGITNWV